MGTFRNVTTNTYKVTNISGEVEKVQPNHEVLSFDDLDYMHSGEFALVSEEPRWNPLVAKQEPSGSGDLSVGLDVDTRKIEFINDTTDVTAMICYNSKNTERTTLPPGMMWSDDDVRYKARTIIVTFDASVVSGEFIFNERRV